MESGERTSICIRPARPQPLPCSDTTSRAVRAAGVATRRTCGHAQIAERPTTMTTMAKHDDEHHSRPRASLRCNCWSRWNLRSEMAEDGAPRWAAVTSPIWAEAAPANGCSLALRNLYSSRCLNDARPPRSSRPRHQPHVERDQRDMLAECVYATTTRCARRPGPFLLPESVPVRLFRHSIFLSYSLALRTANDPGYTHGRERPQRVGMFQDSEIYHRRLKGCERVIGCTGRRGCGRPNSRDDACRKIMPDLAARVSGDGGRGSEAAGEGGTGLERTPSWPAVISLPSSTHPAQ